jgi:hypothetical protein
MKQAKRKETKRSKPNPKRAAPKKRVRETRKVIKPHEFPAPQVVTAPAVPELPQDYTGVSKYVHPYLRALTHELERVKKSGSPEDLERFIIANYCEVFNVPEPPEQPLELLRIATAYKLQEKGYVDAKRGHMMPSDVLAHIKAAVEFNPEGLGQHVREETLRRINDKENPMAKIARKQSSTKEKTRGRKAPKSSTEKQERPKGLNLVSSFVKDTDAIRNGPGKTSGLPIDYYAVYILEKNRKSGDVAAISKAIRSEFGSAASERWDDEKWIRTYTAMYNRGALRPQTTGFMRKPSSPIELEGAERATSKKAPAKKGNGKVLKFKVKGKKKTSKK